MSDRNLPATNPERRLTLTMADYREVIKRPLTVLPEELRPAVLRLWVMHKHLAGMDTPLPIAGALTVWVEEHGLHKDDAVKILDELQSPFRMAEFKFASDLMTALAQSVAAVVTDRKKREAAEDRRREAAEMEANRLPPEQVSKQIRTIKEMMADRTTVPPARDRSNDQRNNEFARAAQ